MGESRLDVGGLYMGSAWVIQQSKKDCDVFHMAVGNDNYVSLRKGLMNPSVCPLPVLGQTARLRSTYTPKFMIAKTG